MELTSSTDVIFLSNIIVSHSHIQSVLSLSVGAGVEGRIKTLDWTKRHTLVITNLHFKKR